MADSRQTKIVSYQLQGDTTDLMQELKSAVTTLDALDAKLTHIASETRRMFGKDKPQTFQRASAISAAETQIEKLRTLFDPRVLETVSPDQLNLIKQANAEFTALLTKLESYKSSQTVTQKALDKTAKSLKNVNNSLKNGNVTLPKATKAWTTFTQGLSKAQAVMFLILKLLHYLDRVYTASSDFVETMNLFNVATKGSRTELLRLANAMADAYNTDVGGIINAIAVFRQYANTMGLANEQADIFGEYLTKITYDLASLYNTSNTKMFSAVKSALAGQTKPLMAYGISVHRATLEQYALNLGLEKSWSSFSETEKVALRYIAILDQASLAQGDLAKTLESPSNQLKVAKAQFQIFLRNLGNIVTLMAYYVMPVFNGAAISINKFLEALTVASGYQISDYSDNLSGNQLAIEESTDSVEEYSDALSGLLSPLDEINQAADNKNADKGLGSIDPKILEALKGYDNLMDRVSTRADILAEALSNVLHPDLGKGIGAVIGPVFDTFGTAITVVGNALVTLSPALRVVTQLLGVLLQGTGWMIDHVVSPILSFVDTLTKNIWLLVAAFAALNLMQFAVTGEFQAMYAVKMAQWFASLTTKIWANTTAMIANKAEALRAKVVSIALAAVLWWEAAAWWQKAVAIIAAAGAAALVVAGIVITATTSAKTQADSTMSSNNVPMLASGGVTTGPTPAIIGEGRYREAVIPLGNSPQFKSMKDDIASEVLRKISPPQNNSLGQLSRTPQPIIIQLDGREVGRGLLPSIGNVYQQTGVNLYK